MTSCAVLHWCGPGAGETGRAAVVVEEEEPVELEAEEAAEEEELEPAAPLADAEIAAVETAAAGGEPAAD